MGLYLAIFDGENELDGVEVGAYADFGTLRNTVVKELESGDAGARFPTLILHSDCDGQWTPLEAVALGEELQTISTLFRKLPPIVLKSAWQIQTAKTFCLSIESLYDCFFDVDGESLLARLASLAELSHTKKLPILFQ
jgi:hypothetical protein